MRLIPHWLYGPGENALLLTREFGTEFRPLNESDTSGAHAKTNFLHDKK
jgi:hypothetical protein